MRQITRCAAGAMLMGVAASAGCSLVNEVDEPIYGWGGGSGVCAAGETRNCYAGPESVRGIGACVDGVSTCQGGDWGTCVGFVLPQAESCGDGVDNDCNGWVDDNCPCTPGSERPCYTGVASTEGVGVCTGGTQVCAGATWPSECPGEVLPTAEICDDGLDNDCNGAADDGASCGCAAGQTTSCYSGPAGTAGHGLCRNGTLTCLNGVWPQGSCPDEVIPHPEVCNGEDDDCDDEIDEGNPAGGEACDTGALGRCAEGEWTCQPTLQCVAQYTPTPESCNNEDDDCNGAVDDGLGSTSCGVGSCAHTQQNCVAGNPMSCNPMQGAVAEICDGVDNDCDGVVDDPDPIPLCDEPGGWFCYGLQGCVWNGTCPFLYTWDGVEFGFEADMYGSGKLGVENSSGFVLPHPEDYHVLFHEPALLDGSIELRLVEERSEVNYFDFATLVAAYVPDTLELYPELHAVGSSYRSLEQSLHTIAVGTTAPVSAMHLNAGASVLEQIAASDQNFAVLNEDRNMMDYQTVELDLGNLSGAPQIKLLIDARTAFANSPEGKQRRAQFGARTKLEVLDAGGQWVEVPKNVATLFPPKEVRRPFVLDLTNAFLTNDYRVRFTFLYKTYIDSIAVDTTADVLPMLTSTLLESADLSYYGHSLRVGNELFELVYGSVEQDIRPAFPGAYTRYGDVTELLGVADDKHVIYWAGDQVKLRFAPADPAPPGMRRFYILQAKGYYKDVTYRPAQTVEPLPFAAMSSYPYELLTEQYPTDAEHVAYRQLYNTRQLP